MLTSFHWILFFLKVWALGFDFRAHVRLHYYIIEIHFKCTLLCNAHRRWNKSGFSQMRLIDLIPFVKLNEKRKYFQFYRLCEQNDWMECHHRHFQQALIISQKSVNSIKWILRRYLIRRLPFAFNQLMQMTMCTIVHCTLSHINTNVRSIDRS